MMTCTLKAVSDTLDSAMESLEGENLFGRHNLAKQNKEQSIKWKPQETLLRHCLSQMYTTLSRIWQSSLPTGNMLHLLAMLVPLGQLCSLTDSQ